MEHERFLNELFKGQRPFLQSQRALTFQDTLMVDEFFSNEENVQNCNVISIALNDVYSHCKDVTNFVKRLIFLRHFSAKLDHLDMTLVSILQNLPHLCQLTLYVQKCNNWAVLFSLLMNIQVGYITLSFSESFKTGFPIPNFKLSPHLHRLSLIHSSFSTLQWLFRALKDPFCNLHILSLQESNVEEKVFKEKWNQVADMLKVNTSLTSLNIRGFGGGKSVRQSDVEIFEEVLQKRQNVNLLSFECSDIGISSMIHEALFFNESLKFKRQKRLKSLLFKAINNEFS
jgi:hypothetical protein